LKVNHAPLERLLHKLVEKNVHEITGNEAFAILDQILEEVSFNPDDVDSYLENFSSVVPLDANKFYIEKNQIETPKVVLQESVQPAHKPAEATKPDAQQNTDKGRSKNTSINDSLNKQNRPTLADNFQKISKIKDSLTINQKFIKLLTNLIARII
jgi:hypothetical protein